MSNRRPPRPWLAALLVLLITGTYTFLWQVIVEQASCPPEVLCVLGAGLLMWFVGGPLAIVLTVVAFRTAGSAAALAGTGFLLLALFASSNLAAAVGLALDPPLWAWPFLLALLAWGWMRFERRLSAPGSGQPFR